MKANQLAQAVFSTLTQQGSTMLINWETLKTYINFALTDLFTYEWRIWQFQYVTWNSVTTSGASSSFAATLPNAKDNILRLVSLRSRRGSSVIQEDVKFVVKQDGFVSQQNEVFYRQGGNVVTFFDQPGNPLSYGFTYVKGYSPIASLNDDLPCPDAFAAALHSLTLAYCSLPYGQYSDGKEVNFYQKGMNQLANLAKCDGAQVTSVISKVK